MILDLACAIFPDFPSFESQLSTTTFFAIGYFDGCDVVVIAGAAKACAGDH